MQEQQSIFPIPHFQLPQYLFSRKIDSKCSFIIRKRSNIQIKSTSLQDQNFENHQIIIGIVGQFIVQINPKSQQIISGFKCDFEIKFWMLRAPSVGNNILGKVQGIAFQFPKTPQNTMVSLFLQQENKQERLKDLQLFTLVLQRKYIVQKQFHQKYKAIKRIGKGVTACVYSALCLSDKSTVAIKSFKKDIYFNQDNGNGKRAFLKQFKILTQLKCNYLSKLLGVYESENSIYIVQQLLDKTLYNYLKTFGFPQTANCRKMLYKLLIGLRFLHKKNIMHRDIKLQNILIRGNDKQNIQPVIVDFGLAEYTNSPQFVYVRCGTPGYVAPQIINLSKEQKNTPTIPYDKSCDIFSMGVIFHILLLGKAVFQGDDVKVVVQGNRQCQIDYQFKNYPRVSPQIKDLLGGMLRKQPKQRYTVEELMIHSFFKQQSEIFAQQVQKIDSQMVESLRQYFSQSSMMKQ